MNFPCKKMLPLLTIPIIFSLSSTLINANPEKIDASEFSFGLHGPSFRSFENGYKPKSILADLTVPETRFFKSPKNSSMFRALPDVYPILTYDEPIFREIFAPQVKDQVPQVSASDESSLSPQSNIRKLVGVEKLRKVLGLKEDETYSACDPRYYLYKGAEFTLNFSETLFEPFIQDAPKALDALKKEGEKLGKIGAKNYVQDVVGNIATTALNHPFSTIFSVGGVTLGLTDFLDATSLPSIVSIAGQFSSAEEEIVSHVKTQAPKAWEALKEGKKKASEEGILLFTLNSGKTAYNTAYDVVTSDSFQSMRRTAYDIMSSDAFWTAAKIGAGFYLLSKLPIGYTQATPTLQNICTLSNPGGSSNPTSSASLTNGGYVTLWQDGTSNVVGTTGFKNCTMIATQFGVSTTTASPSITPSVAGLTNGNWCGAWQSGTSILATVGTPGGTRVFSPMTLDPVASTAQNSPSAAGLTGGKCLVAWTNSTAGTYAIPVATFNADGTGLTTSVLTSGSTLVGAPWATSLTNGNAQVCWTGSSLVCVEVSSSATAVGSPSTINLSGSPIGNPVVAGLSGGNATVVYSHGTFTILDRSTVSATGSGVEYTLPNTTTTSIIDFTIGAAVSNPGATSDTALISWSDGLVEARLTDGSAQPVSSPFLVSTNIGVGNPQGSESVVGLKDGSGDYFVSWVNTNNNNVEGRGISFQTPSPTSSPTSATASPTTAGGTASPTTAGGTASPTTAGGTASPTTAGGTASPTTAGGTASPTSDANSLGKSLILPIISLAASYLFG